MRLINDPDLRKHGWPTESESVAKCFMSLCEKKVIVPTQYSLLVKTQRFYFCSYTCYKRFDSALTKPNNRFAVNRVYSASLLTRENNSIDYDPMFNTAINRKINRLCSVCEKVFLKKHLHKEANQTTCVFLDNYIYFFCSKDCREVFDLTPWHFTKGNQYEYDIKEISEK
jgi:YHS domain-containing protein